MDSIAKESKCIWIKISARQCFYICLCVMTLPMFFAKCHNRKACSNYISLCILCRAVLVLPKSRFILHVTLQPSLWHPFILRGHAGAILKCLMSVFDVLDHAISISDLSWGVFLALRLYSCTQFLPIVMVLNRVQMSRACFCHFTLWNVS